MENGDHMKELFAGRASIPWGIHRALGCGDIFKMRHDLNATCGVAKRWQVEKW
jgi:hypothetical protein